MSFVIKRSLARIKPAIFLIVVFVLFQFYVSEKENSLRNQTESLLRRVKALQNELLERDKLNLELAEEVNKTSDAVAGHTKQLDILAQHFKRYNLKFYGLPENDGEDPVKLVNKLIEGATGTKLDSRSIEYGMRLHGEGPPRPILVKFLRWKDKSHVFQRRKSFPRSVRIEEDLTERQRRKSQELMLYAEKAQEQVKFVKWNGKRLFVDGKEINLNRAKR